MEKLPVGFDFGTDSLCALPADVDGANSQVRCNSIPAGDGGSTAMRSSRSADSIRSIALKVSNSQSRQCLHLEKLAEMSLLTGAVNADTSVLKSSIIQKHFNHKHGKDAYYGQK